MESIGLKIKEQRLKVKKTLEDVSNETKFTLPFLRALESGNLDFFKHDLSYLSYYIRHVANSVGLDYEEIREDVERLTMDITQAIDTKEIEKRQSVNERIQLSTAKRGDQASKLRATLKKKQKSIDFSFLAFISTTLLLLAFLIYVSITYLPKLFKQDPTIKPPIVDIDKNGDDTDTDDPVIEEPEPVNVIEIVAVDDRNYQILNWVENEETEFTLKIVAPQTWIALVVNQQQLSDPVSKTYKKDDEIKFKELNIVNKEVMFHLGNMFGNEIYINDEKVVLPDHIQNSNGVVKLYFTFVKEGGAS